MAKDFRHLPGNLCAGSNTPSRVTSAATPSQSVKRTVTRSGVIAASARTGITRRVRLRSRANEKRRSKLRNTSAPATTPSIRLGAMRLPATSLTLVPANPFRVSKQMPSPGARSHGPESVKTPSIDPHNAPQRFADSFGRVERSATPARRPSKKYSDSPRVKLFEGSVLKVRPALPHRRAAESRPRRERPINPLAVITYDIFDISDILQASLDLERGNPTRPISSPNVGITCTRALSWAAAVAVVINIPLNYILIFVGGLGISGAAIASSLAEMGSLAMLLFYVWLKIDKGKYGLKPVYDGKLLVDVLSLSVWSMLHAFISVAPWLLFFVAVEHLGKTELAISNITRSVSAVFFVIVNSFAVTTGSLVSNAIGAGERRAVFIICRKILRLGYSAGFPLIGVAVCYNRLIIGIYTDNELLTEQAFIPFVVTLLNYTFALPGYVYLNAVGGTGKTRITFLFQVTTTVVYLGYLYWLSACTHASLAIYLTAEYLFVILLALQSVFYLRSKQY